ncbi:cyclodeaminase/cyclohydrolase family protein [Pseudomonas solani]|uniref:cyclodeaminase/cyclohydrolase family protein n=1 Tax=Pseudomonas solani TaxID=2731552 RepID=UPI003C2CEFA3
MEQQELSSVNGTLLERPTSQLLNDFGAGKASPGSGSAAALLGLLSAKMLTTVCEISLRKKECESSHTQFEFILKTVKEELEPRLKFLFEADAKDFEKVVFLRTQRDKCTEQLEKSRLSKESLDLLQTATDYTFEIAELSTRLMGFGIFSFENGWHAIRGDSGVAISASMSSVMSSIFIANLNLKTLKRRNYASINLKRCQQIQGSLNELQTRAFSCVTNISSESLESIQLELQDHEETLNSPDIN